MADLAVTLPESRPDDDEDVVWGLSTATALWARGERGDAVVWIRRAAEAAVAAGQGDRGAELSVIAKQVEQALEEHLRQTMPPPPLTDPPAQAAPPMPAPPVPDRKSLGIEVELEPAAPAPEPSASRPAHAPPAPIPPLAAPVVRSSTVAPPPPPPRGPLPSYSFLPRPRVAPRAPILDPWAEETSPGMRVDPAIRGIQVEGDEVVVQMRRPTQPRMAAVSAEDDDVVTSAAPLDVTLRNASRPPAPPKKVDLLPGQIADAAVPSKTANRPSRAPSLPPPSPDPPTPAASASPPTTEPSRPAAPPPPPSLEPSRPAASASPPTTEPSKPRVSPSAPSAEPSRPSTQRPASIAPPRPASRPPIAATLPLPQSFTAPSPAARSRSSPPAAPPVPVVPATAEAPTMPSAPSPLRARSIPPAPPVVSEQPGMPMVPRVPTVPLPSKPVASSSIRLSSPASVRPPPPSTSSSRPPVSVRPPPPPPRPAPSAPLSLDDVVAFASLTPEVRRRIASLARVEGLAADEEIAGFGAALVIDGSASVCATIVDAPVASAEPRRLVTTRGTLSGGAALRIVAGADGARVATWDASAIEEALGGSAPEVLEELARRADRLQALAGATMGPLQDLDDATRAEILACFSVRVVRPGESLVEAAHKLAGLTVVCVGSVDLAGGAGVVRAGELLFPRAAHRDMPAPTAARAGLAGAILLVGDRAIADRLASTPALASEFAD